MKVKHLFAASIFFYLFSVFNIVVADQIIIQTIDLNKVVKISEYILKVEKISGNRYRVTDLLFGVIDKDSPIKGKEVNITDYSSNKKPNDLFLSESRSAPKYIPGYMKIISEQIQKSHQYAEDVEGKILEISFAHLEIFHSIDEKTSADGRAIELMGKTSERIRSIRQEIISLQQYLGNLDFKIQELRKNSTSKIVFLKKIDEKNYRLIAIDGFELTPLEDKVKKAIAQRVSSGNGNFEQGKTYKFVQ